MEDKRITKTKSILKKTIISLLDRMPFEKVSVTDICKSANISRITFYNHYNDKYGLIDDIFADYTAVGKKAYSALQRKNNPKKVPAISYTNILNCILDLYYGNMDFFQYTVPHKNPYLAFKFYDIILKTIEDHTIKEGTGYNLKYTPKQIAGFICYGLAGFINESHSVHMPIARIRKDAAQLMQNILKSDILIE